MRKALVCVVLAMLAWVGEGAGAQGIGVRAALSAPYATGLAVSADGKRFAWVEDAEGVHNVWVAGVGESPRMVTHYSADDAQDVAGLQWSPDGQRVAYVYGAETGQSGRPANPAHLQRPTPVEVWVAFADGKRTPVRVGEGRGEVWLPGGRELAYVRGGVIWAAAAEGGGGRSREKGASGAAGTASGARGAAESAQDDASRPEVGMGGQEDGFSGGRGRMDGRQLVWDRGSASGLVVSPDGRWLAYTSRRRAHSFIGLFDLQARVLRFVAPSTGSDSAPVFSRDSRSLAWIREPWTEAREFDANRVSLNPWSVQVADLPAGPSKEAEGIVSRTVYEPVAGEPGSVVPRFATGNPRVWWAEGTTLLFCSEADSWVHLYSVDAATPGAKARLLTPLPGEVEDVSVSADGATVLWAGNQAPGERGEDVDRRHVWRMATKGGEPERLTAGVGMETRPNLLEDGTVVVMASDARVPMHPAWVRGGTVRDVREGWVPAEYPGAQFAVPQQAVFPARLAPGGATAVATQRAATQAGRRAKPRETGKGGAGRGELEIHGQVFLPPGWSAGKGTWPAVVFFHGGPRRQMLLGYPAMDYYSNAYAMNQVLASRGFVVLSVNYRCGIGYGLEFRQCEGAGAAGGAEYEDALAAVRYLRSRGDVDMSRVGIWGGSYGGYFTALGLARNSDLFRAGVDFHGVHDWAIEDNAATDWLKGNNAEKDAIAARARASSPVADVVRWRSPVLLIHGDDDPDVTFQQTPMLADRLRARGVHVEELIFPDELHGFVLHRDWVRAYEATAAFLERELQAGK